VTTPDLQYPIGKFKRPTGPLTSSQRQTAIRSIAATPENLRAAIAGLSEYQLNTEYRPGGWTVRQVVHHVPDSHMNAYLRFKWALTEDTPMIKPYDEAKWAELDDGKSKLVEESLSLLEALHKRWVFLLSSMQPADFERALNHPEWEKPGTLDVMLALYEWHGKHHVAHITELRKREGW
jgi:hypothetical protein